MRAVSGRAPESEPAGQRPPRVRSPHDRLVRSVFSDPRQFALLLRLAGLRLPLSRLRRAAGQIVDLALRAADTDLVFELPHARGGALFVLEHLSRATRWACSRALCYTAQLGEDWRRARRRVRGLVAIAPLLLLHGVRPWRGPRRLGDLIRCPAAWRSLRRHTVDLEPLLIDLARLDDDELARRRGDALGLLALILLKNLPHGVDPCLVWRQAIPLLRRIHTRGDGAERLRPLIGYTETVCGEESMRRLEELAELRVQCPWMKPGFRTAAEVRYGRGLKQGLKQGLEQGRAETRRADLLRLLRSLFKRVPREVQARLEAATPAQLDRWFERTLDMVAGAHADEPAAARLERIFRARGGSPTPRNGKPGSGHGRRRGGARSSPRAS